MQGAYHISVEQEEKQMKDQIDENTLRETACAILKAYGVMGNVRMGLRKKSKHLFYSERQSSVFQAVLYEMRPEWEALIKKFEEENNAYVFHAQLTHMEFGDCLSLLYLSKSPDELPLNIRDYRSQQVLSYVINLDDENCSEFGYIGIAPSMGGIKRTA